MLSRTEALNKWNSLSISQQKTIVDKWKLKTTHFAKKWTFEMISASTSVIQVVLNNQ